MSHAHFLSQLPALAGTLEPPFSDARSAREWLKLLPLINVPVAHAEMRQALHELNRSAISALDSLKIAEQFREAIHILQDGLLAHYCNKAIPLLAKEADAWQAALSLWQELEACYARCWHAALIGQSEVADFQPLLAERSLYCCQKVNLTYLLVHRAIPAQQWQQQFCYYQLAVSQGIAQQKARDSLLLIGENSCAEHVFLHSLLLSVANPFLFSLRDLQWINERLELFATRCSLQKNAETLPGRTPYYIDLNSADAPQRLVGEIKDQQLSISTLHLAQVLSKRIKLLRSGELPEKIGLGTTLGPQAAEQLLLELYRLWCEHPSERSLPRREQEKTVEVGFGLTNLHHWIAQGRFTPPPQEESQLTSQELMQIRLFGQTSTYHQAVAAPTIHTHRWQIKDETAKGMHLYRKHTGDRTQLQQLLIIQDQQHFLIGNVRWLSDANDELHIGVQLLPGVPQAATVRAQDAARFGQAEHTAALLLPAMPALKTPNSLILPSGWFRQGRLLEMWDGQAKIRIRLVSILSRGTDFERVHFLSSGGQN